MDNISEVLELVKSDPLSADELFDVLGAERRRSVLSCLQTQPTPIALAKLARKVAKHEATEDAPTPEKIKQVHVSLFHIHLPKLENVGLITYDADSKTVRRTS